jgi:hypothetical protein
MRNLSLATKTALLLCTFCVGVALVIGVRFLANSREIPDAMENLALSSPGQQIEFPESTPTPENISLSDKPVQYLCDHLVDLKKMAWNGTGFSNDAVYDALKRNGYDAMPCLIDKITDTRPAQNPTGAPFWSGLTYRVGDTAVNMLMDINEMPWPKGMLPKKYEKMFKDEGMFSYYFYVDEAPGARKQVQRWWRNWLKTCKPECAFVPLLE